MKLDFIDLEHLSIAEKHRVTIAEVERSLCRCLGVLSRTLDEKDPCWWRFLPW